MSILAFALGVLLAAAGLVSVFHGYGIVEVERGWTEVIAGTVALTGGMVVMMLALLLHAIRDLRAKLSVAGAGLPQQEARAEPPAPALFTPPVPIPAVPMPPIPMPDVPMPAVPSPVVSMPPLPAASAGPGFAAESQEAEAALFGAPEPHVALAAPEQPAAPAAESADPAAEPADPWRDLDAELARLDHEEHGFAPATAPATLEPMAAAEPLAPPAPESAAEEPSPEPESPAVVGRYQADGTSYVMYADGSIEAQGPEGTYRFGSMAELKAFIEAKV